MYADIIKTSAEFIVSRFRGQDCAFIDTKFDITTGADFAADAEPFFQRDYIYTWIQGRGMESLAEHIVYFNSIGEERLAADLKKMLFAVMMNMEQMRLKNGGRLGFAMSPEGKTRFPGSGEYANFSDLFYSKGLFAAALVLQDETLAQAAEKLFRFVINDIVSDRFRTDQHGFDPKNPVAFVPGKLIQGPRMIALYGLARFAAAQPDEPFLSGSFDRDLLSPLDLIPCHLQLMEEIFKVLRLSGEDPVDLVADMISQFWPLRVVCPLHPLTVRLRFDD